MYKVPCMYARTVQKYRVLPTLQKHYVNDNMVIKNIQKMQYSMFNKGNSVMHECHIVEVFKEVYAKM